jgi:hypothetical protein
MNSADCMRIITGFLIFMTAGMAAGQEQVIALEGITDAEMDRFGNLFLSTEQGSIIKYDSSYRKVLTYSSGYVLPVTSLDAGNNFRIFGFYKSGQRCLLLDRNFRLLNELDVNEWAGNVSAAAYASDNSLWLFDEMDLSLSKIDPQLNQVTFTVKLPLIIRPDKFSVIQLEEYQNRLYLNNMENGVYVFDLFGNLLLQAEISTRHFFKFHGEKLFFIDQNYVKSFHIYLNTIETVQEIRKSVEMVAVLGNDNQIFLVYHDHVIRMR